MEIFGKTSYLLQDMFSDFGCTVLDYADDKIMVDYFYSEDMYYKWLSGSDCRQGMGMRNQTEKIEFNKIPDGKLVIVKKDGIESRKYKYRTIFKATLQYRTDNIDGSKKIKRSVTFSIRINRFDVGFNLMIPKDNLSLDFTSMIELKRYLEEKYGKNYTLTSDWRVWVEENASDRPRDTKFSC